MLRKNKDDFVKYVAIFDIYVITLKHLVFFFERSLMYVSAFKTLLIFLSITILNILPILMSFALLGFNDSGDTFTLWTGFIQSIELMIFPIVLCSPLYVIGYYFSKNKYLFFYQKIYKISVLLVLLTFFLIYWYFCSSVY